MSSSQTVHLDHLIRRDSIYRRSSDIRNRNEDVPEYQVISFKSMLRDDDLFRRLRKPDFQRATNAWTPENCCNFLDSVIQGLLIPHTILWSSPRSRNIYVLDGAHRISVLRAWMTDDWGDSGNAKTYYSRFDRNVITNAADEVREVLCREIGSFESCRKLAEAYNEDPALAEMQMTDRQKTIVGFYQSFEDGAGLKIHWAKGDYEFAAKSFVRINLGGQRLDNFEVFLIQNRDNPFIRSLMAVAGGQNEGEYWPGLTPTEVQQYQHAISEFNQLASRIYARLFIPGFDVPPTDVHQPLVPTTPAYPVHHTLKALMPIVLDGAICTSMSGLQSYFEDRFIPSSNWVISELDIRLVPI